VRGPVKRASSDNGYVQVDFLSSFLGFGDLFFIFSIEDKAIEPPSLAGKPKLTSPGRGIKSFISL